MKLRKSYPKASITESHPKALLRALGLNDWTTISNCFSLHGPKPSTDHERDALLGAVAAREGSSGRWKLDLALSLDASELGPKDTWFGEVHYWWPEAPSGSSMAPHPKATVRYGSKSTKASEADLKVCPECGHVFQGKGWGGIDAHWKAKHEDVLPYEEAWRGIEAGTYKAAGR